jgi:hypothetical protein
MPHRLALALSLTGFALLVPGCQRVNVDKTVTLTAGAVEAS